MPALYVNEYARQARDSTGALIAAGEEPALAKYAVAITGASVNGQQLNAACTFVRLHADAICSIEFGDSASVVALTTKDRIAASAVEYRGINPQQAGKSGGLKIAVISNV